MMQLSNNRQNTILRSKKGSPLSGRTKSVKNNNGSMPEKLKGLLKDTSGKEKSQHKNADNGLGQLFSQAEIKTTPKAAEGDAGAVDQIKAKFGERFKKLADKPEAFHGMMKKIYGPGMDRAKAESLRQKAQKGDFGWLPKIEVRPAKDMNGGLGAYDAKSDVVYLNKETMSNPDKAMQVYAEEVGHAMDKKFKQTDTKGDEGEMFRRLFMGEKLGSKEVEKIRNENDHGVVNIDGRKVEVEFFLGKVFKGVGKMFKGAVKGVGKMFKGAAKGIGRAVKGIGRGIGRAARGIGRGIGRVAKGAWKGVKKVMNSGIFQGVLTAAQFIPPLAPFATVGRIASSAYQAFKGIKNGNFLQAAMGVIGGATDLGKSARMFGLSSKFANVMNKVSEYGQFGLSAYHAAKTGRYGDLALALAGKFAPKNQMANIGKAVHMYQHARVIKNNLEQGNELGAFNALTSMAGGMINDGSKLDKALDTIHKIGGDAEAVQQAIKDKDWGKVADIVMNDIQTYTKMGHEDLKSAHKAFRVAKAVTSMGSRFKAKDYIGAGLGLAEAGHLVSNDKTIRDQIASISRSTQDTREMYDAIKQGDYGRALGKLNDILNRPVILYNQPQAKAGISRQSSKAIEKAVNAKDYDRAASHIVRTLGQPAASDKRAVEKVRTLLDLAGTVTDVVNSVQRDDLKAGHANAGGAPKSAVNIGQGLELMQDIRSNVNADRYLEALPRANQLLGKSWNVDQWEQKLAGTRKTLDHVQDAVDQHQWQKAAKLTLDAISEYTGVGEDTRADVNQLARLFAEIDKRYGS